MNSIVMSFGRLTLALILVGGLGACSSLGLQTDPTYTDKDKETLYEHGSLSGDNGGFSLLGRGKDDSSDPASGLGVNALLWRATLDTVSFLPLAVADPFGGVITTDWSTPAGIKGERVKVSILILDRTLRADGVRVTVFRQVQDKKGNWLDQAAAPEVATNLENAILSRARQMRHDQRARTP